MSNFVRKSVEIILQLFALVIEFQMIFRKEGHILDFLINFLITIPSHTQSKTKKLSNDKSPFAYSENVRNFQKIVNLLLMRQILFGQRTFFSMIKCISFLFSNENGSSVYSIIKTILKDRVLVKQPHSSIEIDVIEVKKIHHLKFR